MAFYQANLEKNLIKIGVSMMDTPACLATSYSHRGKPPTTIGAEKLNFRVRYGNGCDLLAIVTKLFNLKVVLSKLDNAEEEITRIKIHLCITYG